MQPEAYLFDLDGTLIDTAPDLSNALNHALAAAGIAPVTEALTRHWVGHGVRAMLGAAFEHHDLEPEEDRFEEFVAVLLTHYERHIADCSRPYPTVVETLKALGERAPLAVVTNKPFRFTELLLEALDLTHHFATVIGGDTATKPKPAQSLRFSPASVWPAPRPAPFSSAIRPRMLAAPAPPAARSWSIATATITGLTRTPSVPTQ